MAAVLQQAVQVLGETEVASERDADHARLAAQVAGQNAANDKMFVSINEKLDALSAAVGAIDAKLAKQMGFTAGIIFAITAAFAAIAAVVNYLHR